MNNDDGNSIFVKIEITLHKHIKMFSCWQQQHSKRVEWKTVEGSFRANRSEGFLISRLLIGSKFETHFLWKCFGWRENSQMEKLRDFGWMENWGKQWKEFPSPKPWTKRGLLGESFTQAEFPKQTWQVGRFSRDSTEAVDGKKSLSWWLLSVEFSFGFFWWPLLLIFIWKIHWIKLIKCRRIF